MTVTGDWQAPEARIRKLRDAVAQRQQDLARAQADLAVARQREKGALEALKAEFGVDSLQAATELLEAREADLEQACSAAEAALKEAR